MAAERLIVPGFYLLWTLVALGLALAAKQRVLIALGLMCLFNWFIQNLLVEITTGTDAPFLIPIKDALLAFWVLIFARHLRIASIVFGLFVVMEIVHADAGLTNTQGRPSYYLTLNALYFLQLVAVGLGSGLALQGIRNRRGVVAGLRPLNARMDVKEQ